MARNVLFDVIALEVDADGSSSSGDLAAFDLNDFSQIVIQATGSSSGAVAFQVSADGTNWLNTGTSLNASSGNLGTAVADVAFPHGRFHFSNVAPASTLTIRVLGRI